VANWDLGEPKKKKRRVFSSSVLDTFWPSHMYVCMYVCIHTLCKIHT
jgi:hypothetical protein